jgi:hypothetical protein
MMLVMMQSHGITATGGACKLPRRWNYALPTSLVVTLFPHSFPTLHFCFPLPLQEAVWTVPPEVEEVQKAERAEAEARAAEERAKKEAQLALMRRQQAEQQALQVGPHRLMFRVAGT